MSLTLGTIIKGTLSLLRSYNPVTITSAGNLAGLNSNVINFGSILGPGLTISTKINGTLVLVPSNNPVTITASGGVSATAATADAIDGGQASIGRSPTSVRFRRRPLMALTLPV